MPAILNVSRCTCTPDVYFTHPIEAIPVSLRPLQASMHAVRAQCASRILNCEMTMHPLDDNPQGLLGIDVFLEISASGRRSVEAILHCCACDTSAFSRGFYTATSVRVFIPNLLCERSQAALEALCMQRAAQAVSFLFAGQRPLVASAFRKNMHINAGGFCSPQSIAS